MTDQSGANNKEVLILTPFFSPNIGGVETHLDDLVDLLKDMPYRSYVLTYQPLMMQIKAPAIERKGNCEIHRIEWFRKLFYIVEPYPILDFLYLTPRLFIATFFFLLNHRNVITIHAQGINAACIAVFLNPLFKTKVIISTHAVYEFAGESLFAKVTRLVLRRADKIFSLLNHSKRELVKLGIAQSKIEPYTYWVDQKRFSIQNKSVKKKERGWEESLFHVIFVGRIIQKKGIRELLESAQLVSNITRIHIIGTGDLDSEVISAVEKNNKIIYHGKIDNKELQDYMQAADCLIVPSTHEEGAGRVIMEALSAGTPVIGSNRGGIPEILNTTVGELIDVSPETITQAIDKVQKRVLQREITAEKCREYAEKHFSSKNADMILNSYDI